MNRKVSTEITSDMDYEPNEKELHGYLPVGVIMAVKEKESELIFYGYSWGDIWGYMLPEERMHGISIWYNRYGIANCMAGVIGGNIIDITKECVRFSNNLCYRRRKIIK